MPKKNLSTDFDFFSHNGHTAVFTTPNPLLMQPIGLVSVVSSGSSQRKWAEAISNLRQRVNGCDYSALNYHMFDGDRSNEQRAESARYLHERLISHVYEPKSDLIYLVRQDEQKKPGVFGAVAVINGQFGNPVPVMAVYKVGEPDIAIKGRSGAAQVLTQKSELEGIDGLIKTNLGPLIKGIEVPLFVYDSRKDSYIPVPLRPAQVLGI